MITDGPGMFMCNIINIQDFYSTNILCSTLQNEGRQKNYIAVQYKRIRRVLLVEPYNLKGRGKWCRR